MLNIYDYIVIIFYFIFIGSMGFMFSKVNKNTSDYFRGGGSMSWWLVGASAFISGISCYTFVSVAGRVYRYGSYWLVVATPFSTIAGILLVVYFAKRYRRMRVVTPVEAVRKRFGKGAEQLLAWQRVLVVFAFGGSWLYIMSVFLAPLTGWSVTTNILISGIIVTVMSVGGGSWAVCASDFVQALLVMIITAVAFYFVITKPEFSNWSEVYQRLAENHPQMTDWTTVARKPVLVFGIFAIAFSSILGTLNLLESGRRYLSVKSDKDATYAALLGLIAGLLGGVIWQIPMILSPLEFPDIYNLAPYSSLKDPEEASYIALCISVLPTGMVGMLVCALFAATMSSMDTRLNMTSGIIVKDIYKAVINKNATEDQMMFWGKFFTGALGVVCIVSGLFFEKLATLPTNDIYMYMNLYVFSPTIVPLSLAIIIKKTPKWAFYASFGAAMLATIVTEFCFDPEAFSIWMGWGGDLNLREELDIDVNIRTLVVNFAGIIVFLLSMFFYKYEKDEKYLKNLDEFFVDMNTPLVAESNEHVHTDMFQNRLIGLMSLAYGGFILLGVFIPNPMSGRLSFLFSGLFMVIIGVLLFANYKRLKNKI